MIGVLLVNLGTPCSPSPKDVYRYLIEFLTDRRVIDFPWLQRQLLVRGLIVPSRYRQSAKSYQHIWMADGSPLMVYGRQIQASLQSELGSQFHVALAMRYQKPSIHEAIKTFLQMGIDHLIVLPLFPQYASATSGSVLQRVQEELCQYLVLPKITLINQFPTHPILIEAFCAVLTDCKPNEYDYLLFSFHGLPERQIRRADPCGKCLTTSSCCTTIHDENRHCYVAQCHATAKSIAVKLHLPSDKYSICFQSRLGKEPWLEPFTSNVIHQLAKQGKKRVLVICPSFVCDCLETLYEISVEYAEEFRKAGGECLQLVPGLNNHPLWIKALKQLVTQQL